MSKKRPQQSTFHLSINQQQLEQIIKALQLSTTLIQQQVDASFDHEDVFYVPVEDTLSMLVDIDAQPDEQKKVRMVHGLCI